MTFRGEVSLGEEKGAGWRRRGSGSEGGIVDAKKRERSSARKRVSPTTNRLPRCLGGGDRGDDPA